MIMPADLQSGAIAVGKLVAHQKQYVLGPMPVRLRPDWIAIRVADDLILSHCPKLSVQRLQSLDGTDFWLLGLAVPVDRSGYTIAESFHSRKSSEIEGWTWFWAGRWMLISSRLCWQDASCSLGVNHRKVDGSLWLSSSTALLSNHLPNAPSVPRIPWNVKHAKGMDWIPAPLTTREGIYKLLPQRAIDPISGSQQPVRFDQTHEETADVLASFASANQTAIANWARLGFTRLRIALTAGVDTRTVLAATCATGVDALAFTNIYSFMQQRDRALPPRLAALAGIPHLFPNHPPVDAQEAIARRAVIAEHMDGAEVHASFEHWAQHEPDAESGAGVSSAHGTCFGLGRCFFWPKFAQTGLSETPPTADQLLSAFTFQSSWRPEPIAAWREAIDRWLGTLAEPVPLAPDWRDRFHLDQRLASWNASVQRAGDFLESTAFSPASCLRMFDLLLRPDPSRRKLGALQVDAIRLMAPQLLRLPINPVPVSERLKTTAKRLVGPKIARRLRPLKTFLERTLAG
jgi:hypothetical protein